MTHHSRTGAPLPLPRLAPGAELTPEQREDRTKRIRERMEWAALKSAPNALKTLIDISSGARGARACDSVAAAKILLDRGLGCAKASVAVDSRHAVSIEVRKVFVGAPPTPTFDASAHHELGGECIDMTVGEACNALTRSEGEAAAMATEAEDSDDG